MGRSAHYWYVSFCVKAVQELGKGLSNTTTSDSQVHEWFSN